MIQPYHRIAARIVYDHGDPRTRAKAQSAFRDFSRLAASGQTFAGLVRDSIRKIARRLLALKGF